MQGPVIVCINCIHFNIENWTCTAFPNGIPDEIAYMGNEHKKPLEIQDNNIIFTPINKQDAS